MNFNVNFNILKQFNSALVGRIKDLITSRCTVQLWGKKKRKNETKIKFKDALRRLKRMHPRFFFKLKG